MVWKKGESGNPRGGPKSKERVILESALEAAKKRKGKHLIVHAIEQAYTDNALLAHILKKILPDKIEDVSEFKERLVLIRPAESKEVKGQTDNG